MTRGYVLTKSEKFLKNFTSGTFQKTFQVHHYTVQLIALF